MSRFLGCVSNKRSVESHVLACSAGKIDQPVDGFSGGGCLPEAVPSRKNADLPKLARSQVYFSHVGEGRLLQLPPIPRPIREAFPLDAPLGDTQATTRLYNNNDQGGCPAVRPAGNRLAASSSPSSCLPFSKVTPIARRARSNGREEVRVPTQTRTVEHLVRPLAQHVALRTTVSSRSLASLHSTTLGPRLYLERSDAGRTGRRPVPAKAGWHRLPTLQPSRPDALPFCARRPLAVGKGSGGAGAYSTPVGTTRLSRSTLLGMCCSTLLPP